MRNLLVNNESRLFQMRVLKANLAFSTIFFVIMIVSINVYAVHALVFVSDDISEGLQDSVDFNACFYEGTIVPTAAIIDVVNVFVESPDVESLSSLDDAVVVFMVELQMLPSDQSFSIEIALDIDSDVSTGMSEPNCFFNGLGADYDVGVEVHLGAVASSWVDEYELGSWNKVGEPDVSIEGSSVTIKIPSSLIMSPKSSKFMVYGIKDISLDMVPDYTISPPEYSFIFTPVAMFSVPLEVDEGTSFQLDATESNSPESSIMSYEWDLDGDGIPDIVSSDSVIEHVFGDDGVYSISLQVADASGYTDSISSPITVSNVPPSNLRIDSSTTEVVVGESLTFIGDAFDPGSDELSFRWDFGDGEHGEGVQVTYTFTTSGSYTISLEVSDDDGGVNSVERGVSVTDVAPEPSPEPDLDPLLIILVFFLGIAGWFIYDYFFRGKNGKKKPEDDDEKDFCEEHPEVVEAEQKACDEALEALDDALGPIEENFENYERTWQDCSREIGRLIGEWDIAYAVVASLTESEAKLFEDAAKVQEIAGKVTGFVGTLKTVAKEGVEEATKNFAEDVAKEASKNAAGDMSEFVSGLLGLQEWAMSEIGVGIAKLITGIDPKKEASDIRRDSLEIVNELESWISDSHSWNSGHGGITLHDFIDDAQKLIDGIEQALQAFENAVSGFRCVTCEITPEYSKHIQDMINSLNGWMRAFGDMIDQITQRLNQAIAMWGLDNAYEDPYQRVGFQNRQIPDTRKAMRASEERTQGRNR
jgi:PKD repeat protein